MRLEEFEYIFAPEQARECLPIWDELGHLTLIGHSHLCKVFALTTGLRSRSCRRIDFELEDGEKYIVSVGSVGQPRDYDNRASYTVYDSDTKRFEFKRVEYDIEIGRGEGIFARSSSATSRTACSSASELAGPARACPHRLFARPPEGVLRPIGGRATALAWGIVRSMLAWCVHGRA